MSSQSKPYVSHCSRAMVSVALLILLTALNACFGCPGFTQADDDDDESCFLVLCLFDTVCVDGECIGCASDDDCDSLAPICLDEQCVECIDDDDCGSGDFCLGDFCVECRDDSDCAPGDFCNGDSCTPLCADVPEGGVCDGNVRRSCSDESIVNESCGPPTYPEGTTCVDVTDDTAGARAFCAVPEGESCVRFLGANGTGGTFVAECAGEDAGCRATGVDQGVCASGLGACTEDDVGTCVDARFIRECNAGAQPFVVDCATLAGATCTDAVGCVVDAGAPCAFGLTMCAPANGDVDFVECPASGTCPP